MEPRNASRDKSIQNLKILEKEIEELLKSNNMYSWLIEHSADGIMLTDPDFSKVIMSNKAAQAMLGRTAEEIREAGRSGIVEQNDHLNHALEQRLSAGYWRGELNFIRSDGTVFPVELTSVCFEEQGRDEKMSSLIFRDITERRRIESQQECTMSVFSILSKFDGIKNAVHSILYLLKDYAGVEAIGIRLQDGEDFPYFETCGFDEKFVARERTLCSYDDDGHVLRDSDGNPYLECMCGNVILGRTDTSLPFFTPGGSFWTNSTTALLASTSDSDRQTRTRNRCNGEGYESVALIPIRSQQNAIGLIQLNDRRPGCFSIGEIEFLEKIAHSVGIAVERESALDHIADSERRYRRIVETSNEGFWGVDQEFVITFMNERAEEALGYAHGELLGKSIAAITFPEDWEAIERKKGERRTGISECFELRLRRKDGSALWVLQTSTPVIDEGGCFQGSFSMITDISGFKAAQQELSSKSKALEEMNNALTVLLKKREDDRMELEKSIVSNLKELVFPYVDRLKRGLVQSEYRGLLEILERNLDEIASPFMQRMASSGLTPREVEVASLIKQRASTKEIATILGISIRAAETHRYNIRKKLGLNSKKSSLQSFLKLQNT